VSFYAAPVPFAAVVDMISEGMQAEFAELSSNSAPFQIRNSKGMM
jgi:hypothetical protein